MTTPTTAVFEVVRVLPVVARFRQRLGAAVEFFVYDGSRAVEQRRLPDELFRERRKFFP
jgi:hypothetical protein